MKQETTTGKPKEKDLAAVYPFATKTGLEMMFAHLLHAGVMCPKCGYATRKTSKRWAKCKKCGERVQRNEYITPPAQ